MKTSFQKPNNSFKQGGSLSQSLQRSNSYISTKKNLSGGSITRPKYTPNTKYSPKNNTENLGHKYSQSAYNLLNIKSAPSSMDVNFKSYGNGTNFERQYSKKSKSISEVLGIHVVPKSTTNIRQITTEGTDGINSAANKKSNFFSNPEFLRGMHTLGPSFISPEITKMAYDEKNRLLYGKSHLIKIKPISGNKTDIININNTGSENCNAPKHFKENRKENKMESDIFNLKVNKMTINKDSERKFPLPVKEFNVCSESGSGWYARKTTNTLFNHPSVTFNILSPGKKMNTNSLSKEDVMTLDPERFAHKKKSIAEYVDVFRNFNPNPNHTFRKSYEAKPKGFFQNSNICANFNELYKSYSALINPPHEKKF